MNAPIAVAPARAGDVGLLADLHAACFAQPWGPEALARLLATPGAFALVGRYRGVSPPETGFVLARAAAAESEILSIGVLPAHRRRGMARALIVAAAARVHAAGAIELFLEVDEENQAAQELYRDIGFVETGRRPGYYLSADGQRRSARIMRLPLR